MLALGVAVIAVVESLRDDGIRYSDVFNRCCAICSAIHSCIGREGFVHSPREREMVKYNPLYGVGRANSPDPDRVAVTSAHACPSVCR